MNLEEKSIENSKQEIKIVVNYDENKIIFELSNGKSIDFHLKTDNNTNKDTDLNPIFDFLIYNYNNLDIIFDNSSDNKNDQVIWKLAKKIYEELDNQKNEIQKFLEKDKFSQNSQN